MNDAPRKNTDFCGKAHKVGGHDDGAMPWLEYKKGRMSMHPEGEGKHPAHHMGQGL